MEAETGCPLPPPEDGAGARVVDLAGGSTARFEDKTVGRQAPGLGLRGVTRSGPTRPWRIPKNSIKPDGASCSPRRGCRPLQGRSSPASICAEAKPATAYSASSRRIGHPPRRGARAWLARQGEGPGLAAVDPVAGPVLSFDRGFARRRSDVVPVLAGCLLGRRTVAFRRYRDYARYAQALVEYERGISILQKSRRSVLFATRMISTVPLRCSCATWRSRSAMGPDRPPAGHEAGVRLTPLLKRDARKSNLLAALADGEGPASLLFSARTGCRSARTIRGKGTVRERSSATTGRDTAPSTEDDWLSAGDLRRASG